MAVLNMGDKLTHKESGDEAEYFLAVPTVTHGFMHILKTAGGYVMRLTGDLEAEFKKKGEVQTLAESGSPLTAVDQSVMNELADLKALIRGMGVKVDNPTGEQGTPLAPVTAANDEASSAATAPWVPDAASHLAPTTPTPPTVPTPADEETDEEAAAPDEPETVEPPANSIPF
jgi:hypothetical protein